MSRTYMVVADPVTGKVGCTLLQAAMGGDAEIAAMFDSEQWELKPTPDMKAWAFTEEQLQKFIVHVNGTAR